MDRADQAIPIYRRVGEARILNGELGPYISPDFGGTHKQISRGHLVYSVAATAMGRGWREGGITHARAAGGGENSFSSTSLLQLPNYRRSDIAVPPRPSSASSPANGRLLVPTRYPSPCDSFTIHPPFFHLFLRSHELHDCPLVASSRCCAAQPGVCAAERPLARRQRRHSSSIILAQLFRPAGTSGRFAAVALFHGCGGAGARTRAHGRAAARLGLRRAGRRQLLVARSHRCRGRNWPTQADAEKRAGDIDAALAMAWAPDFRRSQAARLHGLLLRRRRGHVARVVGPDTDARRRSSALGRVGAGLSRLRAGRCAGTASSPCASRPCSPWGALDDWTPVPQCEAVIGRVVAARDLVETHVYEGAHHSFDALGLPVRYLAGVGNRSKPGGCCGAHYGANEAGLEGVRGRREGLPGAQGVRNVTGTRSGTAISPCRSTARSPGPTARSTG